MYSFLFSRFRRGAGRAVQRSERPCSLMRGAGSRADVWFAACGRQPGDCMGVVCCARQATGRLHGRGLLRAADSRATAGFAAQGCCRSPDYSVYCRHAIKKVQAGRMISVCFLYSRILYRKISDAGTGLCGTGCSVRGPSNSSFLFFSRLIIRENTERIHIVEFSSVRKFTSYREIPYFCFFPG